ncbi:MAG: isochorismate synthase [Chloroflexi bacterium]|nr:isochorismate synthase [Chloroflexota bacterium]MCY4248073.1 isochorismate synthase [Chloroflexota bacterium]
MQNSQGERLLSCSLPCPGIAPQDFLAVHDGSARFAWASADGSLELAGAGSVAELFAWGNARFATISRDARALFADALQADNMPPLAGPRLFGGFAFRHDFTPDNIWSIYMPAWFVLPHYQLAHAQAETWLTINAQMPQDEAPAAMMKALEAALRAKIDQLRNYRPRRDQQQSRRRDIDYPMSLAAWTRMIEQARDSIHAGQLNKVVLSRAAELRFDGAVQLLPILRYLAKRYGDCYRFLFEPRPRYAFYGASPELLAAISGRHLYTMALAGSIKRGASTGEDEILGSRLLQSAKERGEQQIVVDKICERLSPLAESLDVQPIRLRKLRHIQHLYTPVHARLNGASGLLSLANTLHPTPALGGDPRHAALRLIRQLEPIPRGWYGAPVGWLDAQLDGQFAVAIRSAVAQESRVWLYAGAGIVAHSQAQAEWDETALKLRPMLDAHAEHSSANRRQR